MDKAGDVQVQVAAGALLCERRHVVEIAPFRPSARARLTFSHAAMSQAEIRLAGISKCDKAAECAY
jgi:hypothetical protein